MKNPSTGKLWLLASSALAIATQASAQTPPGQSPETISSISEIVVTAQRRSESVQTVPISISVVSGQQLERQQVTELRDLSRSVAGLEFGANSGNAPGGGASIRGLGTTAFSRAAEAAVGVVVDGVVQGNANVNNLFDIGRLEVLRGPQGTLFGQSTSAGVINITTIAPNFDEFEGKVQIEASDDGLLGSKFGKQVLRAAGNIPLTQASAVRISAYGARTTGITHNVLLNRDDKLTEFGVRARYLAELGDRVKVNLIADYADSISEDGNFFTYGEAGPRAAAFNAACGVTPSLSNFNHCSDFPIWFKTKTAGASAQIDVELGKGLTLTSISAYRRQRFSLSNDIDRLPEAVTTLNISSASTTKVEQVTQEIRLASDPNRPLSVTVGGYYQDSQTIDDFPGTTGNNLYFARAGLPGPPTLQTRTKQYAVNDLTNLSAFGEARYKVDALTLFGGARVNKSEQDGTVVRTVLAPAPGAPVTIALGLDDTDFSWRAGAQYQFSPEAMLYGTISRGYKSGQVAVNVTPTTVVRPEKPQDFQLGLKTQAFDRRVAINVTAFYTKVQDYQATQTTIDPTTGVVQGAPFNIDKVISKGLELEVFGRLAPGLSINGSALYNVARYPNGFRAQNGGLIEGAQLAGAPRFKATVALDYTHSLTERVEGFIGIDGAYKSRTRYGIESDSKDYNFYKAHTIIGARAGARFDNGLTVTLFARNIGNVASPFSIGQIPQPLGDPALSSRHVYQSSAGLRQIGLQAAYEF